MLVGQHRRLQPGVKVELRQQVLDMTAHRGHAHEQLRSDRTIVEADPDQGQDLQFPLRQLLDHVGTSLLPHELHALVPDDPAQRVRRQQELSRGGAVERRHERGEAVQLEVHQPERACRHEVMQALVIGVVGQDHHAGIGIPGHYLLNYPGPDITSCPSVRKNHVWLSVGQQALGFRKIPPDAHDPDARLGG